jgi:hypothetical protein
MVITPAVGDKPDVYATLIRLAVSRFSPEDAFRKLLLADRCLERASRR